MASFNSNSLPCATLNVNKPCLYKLRRKSNLKAILKIVLGGTNTAFRSHRERGAVNFFLFNPLEPKGSNSPELFCWPSTLASGAAFR